MNSLTVFSLTVLLAALVMVRLFHGTVDNLQTIVANHAKMYALAYIKGAALITIAWLSSFDETFSKLTKDAAAAMPWWVFLCLFFKPILAGLSVFVAFVDSTVARVNAKRDANESAVAAGSQPPFPSVATPAIPPAPPASP